MGFLSDIQIISGRLVRIKANTSCMFFLLSGLFDAVSITQKKKDENRFYRIRQYGISYDCGNAG